MVRPLLLPVLLCVALSGCAGGTTSNETATPPSPSVPQQSATPSLPATPASPSESTTPDAPSTQASDPGSSSPSATTSGRPTVPSAKGALNVARFEAADFSSPTGRIWCDIRAEATLCMFPRGYTGAIPEQKDVCLDDELPVTGVSLIKGRSGYFCAGDPQAWPIKGEPQVDWHKGTGFGFTKYRDQTLAVLPYGKALRRGTVVCRSERTGVVCGDTATGRGFHVSMAHTAPF